MSEVARNASTIFAIIVNWNGWQDTIACLESLEADAYPGLRVVVVDNGSTDSSIDMLRERFPDLDVIETGRNLGFSGGNNVGIQHALARGADYLWLLNNDTVVRTGVSAELVRLGEEHPDYDFFGLWIAFHDNPGELWFGGGTYSRATGWCTHQHYGETRLPSAPPAVRETQWITGCSLIVRRAVCERVGCLDEDLFLYREDLEWQLRASSGHPRALLLEYPGVLHKVGRSTGTSDGFLGTLFMSRNFLKLMRRYSGWRMPGWLMTWVREYVLKPVVRRDRVTLRAATASIREQQTPGAQIVSRYRGRDVQRRGV